MQTMKLSCHTIFSDDIRREDNGKLFIIGAYTRSLSINVRSLKIDLSAWISIRGLPLGEHEFSIRITFPGTSHTVDVNGKIPLEDIDEPADLFLCGFPAQISGSGDIIISLKIAGQTMEAGRLSVLTHASHETHEGDFTA